MKCALRLCLCFLFVTFAMVMLKLTALSLINDIEFQLVNIPEHEKDMDGVNGVDGVNGMDKDYRYAFDDGCDEKFNDTIEENLNVIVNYPGGTADEHMWKIGGHLSKPITRQGSPVLVTAVSRRYFGLLMGMLKSYHYNAIRRENGERINVVIYDIGLTRSQRTAIKNSGMPCEIREFPFGEFPPHVRMIQMMPWKPILIQILLMEFGFVWWVDTSVRFKTLNAESVFEEAKTYGLVFNVSPKEVIHTPTKQTDVEAFKYLGEDICKFRHFAGPEGSSIIVYFNPVSRIIIRAWARCALDKNCILAGAAVNNCDVSKRCDRFDKSVLGILTRRVYHDQSVYSFMNITEEFIEINRNNTIEKCKTSICEI